ncbi:hypothetical protein [Janthinobacterium lividum]|uniref:Uncharacterized protein n=1 Tax=Janthinobacterium lividum TaxID=29581 RepID=A0ABU0XY21_9BURK|nr:hypothetical protein [Janthinobacterium lividum]MDQ4627789.1 hypothetical protein [Janthinobacterium lividum]MDQ4676607.1 hypothetical protein [Janthinobacterium lividum]MDQ4686921.1 hypothetical protein [Janthinobacterium lividum]
MHGTLQQLDFAAAGVRLGAFCRFGVLGEEAASVTLRSEQGELVVFCHPCSLTAGDVIENRLSVLDADVHATYLTDWPESEKEALSTEWIERTDHYAYRGRGRVLDHGDGLVEVQGFFIDMGALCVGHVDFGISRLDLSI